MALSTKEKEMVTMLFMSVDWLAHAHIIVMKHTSCLQSFISIVITCHSSLLFTGTSSTCFGGGTVAVVSPILTVDPETNGKARD